MKQGVKRSWVTVLIMVVLLALDRGSKIFMDAWLAGKGVIDIIPGVIGLHLLEGGNTGGAWGILSNNTLLLIIFSSLVVLVLLYILFVKQLDSPLLHVALLLVTVGGLGNLYDRIVYGSVTDFFEFQFISFPVFNVADCCVSVGVVLAVIWLIFSKSNEPLFASNKRADDDMKAEVIAPVPDSKPIDNDALSELSEQNKNEPHDNA